MHVLFIMLILSAFRPYGLIAGVQTFTLGLPWSIDLYCGTGNEPDAGRNAGVTAGYSYYPGISGFDWPGIGIYVNAEYSAIDPAGSRADRALFSTGTSFLIPPAEGVAMELQTGIVAGSLLGRGTVKGADMLTGGEIIAVFHFSLSGGAVLSTGAGLRLLAPVAGRPSELMAAVRAGITLVMDAPDIQYPIIIL